MCSHAGCASRSRKGGVCMRHGATVKRCGHEGCTANVKLGGRTVFQSCWLETTKANLQSRGMHEASVEERSWSPPRRWWYYFVQPRGVYYHLRKERTLLETRGNASEVKSKRKVRLKFWKTHGVKLEAWYVLYSKQVIIENSMSLEVTTMVVWSNHQIKST